MLNTATAMIAYTYAFFTRIGFGLHLAVSLHVSATERT